MAQQDSIFLKLLKQYGSDDASKTEANAQAPKEEEKTDVVKGLGNSLKNIIDGTATGTAESNAKLYDAYSLWHLKTKGSPISIEAKPIAIKIIAEKLGKWGPLLSSSQVNIETMLNSGVGNTISDLIDEELPQKQSKVDSTDSSELSGKEIFEKIMNKGITFGNLNIPKQFENIKKLGVLQIAASEFSPNKEETAPFNFMVQFAALVDEVSTFANSINHYDFDDAEERKVVNFIYWLSANLFKLNMHISSDPLGEHQPEHAEVIQKMISTMLGVLKSDSATASLLASVFQLLRTVTSKMYEANLEHAEPVQVFQSQVIDWKKHFDRFDQFNQGFLIDLVLPSLIMAVGYSQILFQVGTTKDIHKNVKMSFSVEKGPDGQYSPKTLATAFGKRFRIYAGAYAQWHIIDNHSSIKKADTIDHFKPNEKVVLTIDDMLISVSIPDADWKLRNSNLWFATLQEMKGYIEENNYKHTIVMFPLFS